MSSTPKKLISRRSHKGLGAGSGGALSGRIPGLGKTGQLKNKRAKSLPSGEAFRLTEESAKRLRAIERGRQMMERDLKAAGGTLSTQEVADHLEISAQAVDKQRQAGRLLAVTNSQGHFRYPAFQFTRPQVRQHLQAVLSRLDEDSPFVKLNWLLNPDSRLGAAPVDLLDRGDVEPVLRAADAFGHHVPG